MADYDPEKFRTNPERAARQDAIKQRMEDALRADYDPELQGVLERVEQVFVAYCRTWGVSDEEIWEARKSFWHGAEQRCPDVDVPAEIASAMRPWT